MNKTLRILEKINATPKIMHKQIVNGLPFSYVKTAYTLTALKDLELVRTPERGIYEITEEGMRLLNKHRRREKIIDVQAI
jgi:predicted transcriptional regulator